MITRVAVSPLLRHLSAALLVVLGLGCSDAVTGPPPPQAALFDVLACRGSTPAPQGEHFHVRIADAAVVAQATGRVGRGQGLIIEGQVLSGNGGYNQPWGWHLDPATIQFVQVAVEVCDGCPSGVVAGTQYCPWTTEVLRRLE